MSNAGKLHLPMRAPKDVIPHLGKGELHWRDGYSAKSAAECWFHTFGYPSEVQKVLDQAEEYRGSELLEGWFERETILPWGKGRPTQTDILTLAMLEGGELAVIGIEAKVREPFGPTVREWRADGGENRLERLVGLTHLFGLSPQEAEPLRYQLFHRVAGSWLEARRFGLSHAAMLVHSFCPERSSINDFQAFAAAAGFGAVEANGISSAKRIGDIDLRVGWVCG